jgi:hypothetical protein
MSASLYESLVGEYLETEGYLVYNNLKLLSKQEIDIFAYSPKKETIIAEVKAINPNEKQIKNIVSKFDKDEILPYLNEMYGVKSFKLILFCWDFYENDESRRRFGKKVGFDDIITYPQVLKSIINNIKGVRKKDRWLYDVNRPNSVLLQIIYDALLHGSQYLNENDFKE